MNGYDPYAEEQLRQFDRDYQPQAPQFRPGAELLTDGPYVFRIESVTLERTKQSGVPIVKMVLRVVGGTYDGAILERGSVLTSQQNYDRLGGDLITLGLDADQWTERNGRPFSRELVANLPRLAGKAFAGRKKTSDDGKYHNIYIDSLVGGQSVPVGAPTFSTAPTVGPHAPGRTPPPPGPRPFAQDGDIPF